MMIGFSTANTIPRDAQEGILTQRVLNEEKIDLAFQDVYKRQQYAGDLSSKR